MEKIIIIDDHPLFRAGVKETLTRSGAYEVVFEGSTRADLEKMLVRESHNAKDFYFVIDISLPDCSGFELIPLILDCGGLNKQCIMLSMHDDKEYADHAFDVGAYGYVVKSDDPDCLIECLKTIARGERYTSTSITEKNNATNDGSSLSTQALRTLSKREIAVLKFVAEEKTSREISELLHLSQRTVENHRAKICQKLGVSGAHGLIAFAVKYRRSIDLL